MMSVGRVLPFVNVALLITAGVGSASLLSDWDASRLLARTPAFSALTVRSLDGEKAPIFHSDNPTVYLAVSTHCTTAANVVTDWVDALRGSLPDNTRLALLTFNSDDPETLSRYLHQRTLRNVRAVVVNREEFLAATNVGIVPSALLVSSHGEIKYVKQGKSEGSVLLNDLERELEVLAGISR